MFIQSSECCHWCFSTDFCFYLTFWKVRKLGSILNVPEAFLKRHPFPGPGLAVRVLGDVTEGNALDILRQVLYLAMQYRKTCFISKYLVFLFIWHFSYALRWMRYLFSQSGMLDSMIKSGKLLLSFCLYSLLGSRVIRGHILTLLSLEQSRARMGWLQIGEWHILVKCSCEYILAINLWSKLLFLHPSPFPFSPYLLDFPQQATNDNKELIWLWVEGQSPLFQALSTHITHYRHTTH